MTTSASSSCIVFSANRRSWTDSLEIALWTPTTQKTGVFHWTSRTPKGRHAPGSVHPRTFLIFGFHRRKGFIQAFLSVENEVWVLRRNVCKLRFDWRGAGTCSGLWRWHTLAVSVCLYHCLVAVPWNTSPFTAARLYGCTHAQIRSSMFFKSKFFFSCWGWWSLCICKHVALGGQMMLFWSVQEWRKELAFGAVFSGWVNAERTTLVLHYPKWNLLVQLRMKYKQGKMWIKSC